MPFLLTTVGGFTPRTPNYDGGGIFDPKDAINALFPRSTVPMRGSLGTSIEKGLICSIAVSDNNNALYDQTLPRSTIVVAKPADRDTPTSAPTPRSVPTHMREVQPVHPPFPAGVLHLQHGHHVAAYYLYCLSIPSQQRN